MSVAFYELFGQIGAAIVSVASTLFVTYMLYIKERRDLARNRIVEQRRGLFSLVEQLSDTSIPGVVHSLLSQPREEETWDKLSITSWIAGVSWDMRVQTGEVNASDVWDSIINGIEDLVRGILPDSSFPDIEGDSIEFRDWGRRFISNTEHIEWFCHESQEHSWNRSLLERMKEWESRRAHPIPPLRWQDIASLLDGIIKLRKLVKEELLLEDDYESLRIENVIAHYKVVIASFFAMGFFSIVIPLIVLLFPPVGENYMLQIGGYTFWVNVSYLGLTSFLLFSVFSTLVLGILVRTAMKSL